MKVRKVVIAGGGTAGWMTAAGLSKLLGPAGVEIQLVESEQIGTVGVGEATLPHMRFFNRTLGLDERDVMAFTQATFKLGIEFRDWGKIGDRYIHPFGDYGPLDQDIPFHHIWHLMSQQGLAGRIDDFSLPVRMSELGKFEFPSTDPADLLSTFSYAYQLDASLYAKYLRRYAEANGVKRVEGRITSVEQASERGFLTSLTLEDGDRLDGDFFIDCTGFRAMLIGKTLGADFDDWSAWLPCDRAIAVACRKEGASVPFTRATARPAGWQWRIPLQHRTGNGHVYCSDFMSDDEAEKILLGSLEADPISDPNRLRFRTGMRPEQWKANCVAIGLSSGFLEPLESTSIYLIQAGITALAELFPSGEVDMRDITEFNRVMQLEYDRIRDFLILHYHATERDDSPFWNYVRTMDIPASLQEKLDLFRSRGIVQEYKDGLFLHPSWIAVYLGQGVVPDTHDPRADALTRDDLLRHADLRGEIADILSQAPSHEDALARFSRKEQAVVT